MNILLVLDRRQNAGSIQAAARYIAAGDQQGHTIAIYGPADPELAELRFATDLRAFEYVVFIFESKLDWLSGLRLSRILSAVPRQRRAIVDADGMYNQVIEIDGYDHNHRGEKERARWLESYERIADKIFQPTSQPLERGVVPLLFYGYDPQLEIRAERSPGKAFDILHVGHNWWRWRQVGGLLLPAIEQIRAQVGEIGFVGLWWDRVPPWAGALGLENAFSTDVQRLRRLGIRVEPPVPYTEVIPTMSRARINVMTQRPLFRSLKLLTSKYFEIFCADTIPLVMIDPDLASTVYGPRGADLTLNGQAAETLLGALSSPERYHAAAEQVRGHLATHHGYERRVQELVAALEPSAAKRMTAYR